MKSNTKLLSFFVASGVALQVACGGGGVEVKTPDGKNPGGKPVISAAAEKGFNAAIETFVAHDKANDWNDANCADVAKRFEAAAAEEKAGKLAEATFNAGLAYQRCGNEKEARARFQKALTDNPKFHYARAQLALYDYKPNSNEDATIASLQQAVLDSQFENVPALVNLAMIQMARDSATGDKDCKDDFDCAKKNLQRALAKDDAYMPAFNQLALYYFQLAKKRAGAVKGKGKRQMATNAAMGKRADVQQLELAALVCSQAIRKNPSYAPIHNTAGLIQNELGLVNSAVGEFATAAKLDPRLFEAQMNFAAVNLSFRGFEQAEGAYRNALTMRPNDYDAHLGLALALRGRIDDSNYDKQVAAVQAELDAAKKIDPNRADAYYNEGILTQEYKAKGLEQAKQIATLEQAQSILRTFTEKASGKPEYDGAVKRSKERIEDMDVMKDFIKQGGNVNKAPPPPENTGDATPPPAGGAAGGAPAEPAKK